MASFRPGRRFLLALTAGVALAGALTQSEVVGDTRVSLAVIPEGRGEHPTGQGWPRRHRIVVGLADSRSGRPVADATVSANIAEKPLAGEEMSLESRLREGRPVYETELDLPQRRAVYRVRVQFLRPGSEQTKEVEFRYEHHH